MLSNSTDKQASSMRTVAYVDVVSLCIQPFLDVLTCNLSIMCQAIVLQCISFFGLGIVGSKLCCTCPLLLVVGLGFDEESLLFLICFHCHNLAWQFL